MEMNFHPASRGVAGAGLGLGIAGTALGLLGGNLRNVLGGGCGCEAMAYAGGHGAPVNRYEATQAARIAELETEVKLRDANTYTDSKILELYRYVDGKLSCVEAQLSQQAVYNATNTATLNCLSGQVTQLMALTKTVIPITNICPQPAVATT